VLFTIALLGLVPPLFRNAFTGHDKAAFQRLDWALQLCTRMIDRLSIASLAIVLIGLIVVWAGYSKKVRWTWFVMFVIVWGCGVTEEGFSQMTGNIRMALLEPLIVCFALMVIALALPMKSFFWDSQR